MYARGDSSKHSELVVEYLIYSLDNRTLRCYLRTADTPTATKAVRAIDDYLTVGSSDRPTCKTKGGEGQSGHLAKLAEALTTQTRTLTTQS